MLSNTPQTRKIGVFVDLAKVTTRPQKMNTKETRKMADGKLAGQIVLILPRLYDGIILDIGVKF